jgi:hypothetical protein
MLVFLQPAQIFRGVCGRDNQPLDSQDPPPSIRELTPANATRNKGERGRWYAPAPFDVVTKLRHKLVDVVVVAVVDGVDVA